LRVGGESSLFIAPIRLENEAGKSDERRRSAIQPESGKEANNHQFFCEIFPEISRNGGVNQHNAGRRWNTSRESDSGERCETMGGHPDACTNVCRRGGVGWHQVHA
tara:strand:+ start:255 stop:572 length:318 start_codon:yes stop_codon:yes gene_type:complete